MALPVPAPQPDSGLTFPWAFMTRDSHEAQWGGQGQRVVERMLINWADYFDYNAQTQLCGYSSVIGGQLIRFLPWQHPNFTNLFIDADQGISSVKMVGFPPNVPPGAQKTIMPSGAPWGVYRYVILTLVFTERRYYVRNTNIAAKVARVVIDNPGQPPYLFLQAVDKGTAEYLQLSSGTYQYDPNSVSVQQAGLSGQTFKQGLAVLDSKDTLTYIWRGVPHFWLHNANGIASGILSCLGKVNTVAFLGFLAGQIYFDSHDKEQRSFAIDPVGGDVTSTWAWDVTLFFKFRNPPVGALPTPPAPPTDLPTYKNVGHNTCPAPQAVGAGNGFWYPVVSTAPQNAPVGFIGGALGVGGGGTLYLGTDLNAIFQQAQ